MSVNVKTRIEIKRICPMVKTIEETYPNDEGYIQYLCKIFNCKRNEYLLMKDEAISLGLIEEN